MNKYIVRLETLLGKKGTSIARAISTRKIREGDYLYPVAQYTEQLERRAALLLSSDEETEEDIFLHNKKCEKYKLFGERIALTRESILKRRLEIGYARLEIFKD